MNNTNVFRGTIAQLIGMGLTMNGVKMDQTCLSVLTRLGVARKDGEAPKSGPRGKAATIWVIEADSTLNLTAVVATDATPAVAVEA